MNDHEHIHMKSYEILQKAHKAAKKNGHDLFQVRTELSAIFLEHYGSKPYDWQLNVTEAILLGLDSVIIVGTGKGKTIPFMLSLLLYPEALVLIVSPLKALQKDQVRFNQFKDALLMRIGGVP